MHKSAIINPECARDELEYYAQMKALQMIFLFGMVEGLILNFLKYSDLIVENRQRGNTDLPDRV